MMTYSNSRRTHDILVYTKHEIMKELAHYHQASWLGILYMYEKFPIILVKKEVSNFGKNYGNKLQ